MTSLDDLLLRYRNSAAYLTVLAYVALWWWALTQAAGR